MIRPSEQELAEYAEFVTSQIALLHKSPPKTLWHYTSGDGLIGIVSSHSLWATQVSCLNDAKELRHATDLMDAALVGHRNDTLSERFHGKPNLIARLDQGLRVDPAATSEWFVACLTEKPDDLSQWRGYGGGEGGYSIGFDVASLVSAAQTAHAMLAPVCYDTDLQRRVADRVAAATMDFFHQGMTRRPAVSPDDWAEAFLAAWRNHVVYLAPALKHPTFEAEKEWRLLRPLRAGDRSTMRYRQRGSLLSRYLPLVLKQAQHDSESALLPLTEVVVGPSRHAGISRVGVGDLLSTYGYPDGMVRVSLSGIPFQSH